MSAPTKPGWPSGWQRLFLFALALLNLWVSYVIFRDRPILALANGAMAAALLILLLATWRKRSGE